MALKSHAQFGFPQERSQPSFYEQATGKIRVFDNLVWREYVESKYLFVGKRYLIKGDHYFEINMRPGGKSGDIQTIYYKYNSDPQLHVYTAAGDTNKVNECIDNIVSHPYISMTIAKGVGNGISIRQVNGRFFLWPRAPHTFGNNFDSAGLVAKDKIHYLFAMNKSDNYVTVFLSPTKAEKHYDDGRVEVVSASFLEIIFVYLPVIIAACAGLFAVFVVWPRIKKFMPKRRSVEMRGVIEAEVRHKYEEELAGTEDYWKKDAIEDKIRKEIKLRMKQEVKEERKRMKNKRTEGTQN
jgi:hypothetical protein